MKTTVRGDEVFGFFVVRPPQLFINLKTLGILALFKIKNAEPEKNFFILGAQFKKRFDLPDFLFGKIEIAIAYGQLLMDPRIVRRILAEDPEFLDGNLHREGGVVFFLLGLLLLVPVLWLLQRGEKRRRRTAEIPTAQI